MLREKSFIINHLSQTNFLTFRRPCGGTRPAGCEYFWCKNHLKCTEKWDAQKMPTTATAHTDRELTKLFTSRQPLLPWNLEAYLKCIFEIIISHEKWWNLDYLFWPAWLSWLLMNFQGLGKIGCVILTYFWWESVFAFFSRQIDQCEPTSTPKPRTVRWLHGIL